jgi:hypothetical protein
MRTFLETYREEDLVPANRRGASCRFARGTPPT